MQLAIFLQGRDTISILTFKFNITPEWFWFFCSKDSESLFFKKHNLADLMARWVCRLHNLYFAQRSALFVRLALLYKEAFFRIDARSDLDSEGRFSRGDVILVGINLFRHWFRMDLSFNQFSLTERLGLFSEKEVQQLLIFCLIVSQLAFLNWRTGRGLVPR